jgi:mersacidin/lichenicidin family type 2 lantibiotic
MSNRNIIRAWKDPVYRDSLTEAERSAMPGNPAGTSEISNEDLGKASGGHIYTLPYTYCLCTIAICPHTLLRPLC